MSFIIGLFIGSSIGFVIGTFNASAAALNRTEENSWPEEDHLSHY